MSICIIKTTPGEAAINRKIFLSSIFLSDFYFKRK